MIVEVAQSDAHVVKEYIWNAHGETQPENSLRDADDIKTAIAAE